MHSKKVEKKNLWKEGNTREWGNFTIRGNYFDSSQLEEAEES